MAENADNKRKLRVFFVVFVLANLFLASYFTDIWVTPGSTSRALPVLSLYEDNSLIIDKYEKYTTGDKSKVGDHFYSDKAPLPSFIVYPFYVICKKLGVPEVSEATVQKRQIYIWDILPNFPDGRVWTISNSTLAFILGGIICGSLPFCLALLVVLRRMRSTFNGISPVLLIMLSFYASFIFVFTGVFSGHVLAGFLLLASYLQVKEGKHLWLAGLLMGLAFATEYTVAFIVPLWAIQMYLNKTELKKIIVFCASAIPGVAIIMLYNYSITGSPFKLLYTYVPEASEIYKNAEGLGFSYPKAEAIWGLLFSFYRGLLFYAPALILMLWYFILYRKSDKSGFFNGSRGGYLRSWGSNYLLLACAGYIAIISSHNLWYGGWTYGPRHFIPIAFLLLYEGAILLSKQNFSKIAFYIIAAGGLLCAWLAKATKIYMLPDKFKNPVAEVLWPDFKKGHFNANNFLTWIFDVEPKAAIWIWLFLFAGACYGLSVWYSKLVPQKVMKLAPITKAPAAKKKK